MLYIIDKNAKTLKAIQSSTFQKLKVWERKDLEKWIEDYPEILGEELFVITTEYDKFDRTNDRLDILAIDKNGKLVIIELKRDMAPTETELQAIKYAAFCSNLTFEDLIEIYIEQMESKRRHLEIEEAENEIREFIEDENFEKLDNQPRIILVAGEFRQETTASILWLRTFGIDIKVIKLELYNLMDEAGKNNIAIVSTVIIPLPDAQNFMIGKERKEAETSELTKRQKFFIDLFTRLIERFKTECPGITERGGTKDSWLGLPIGYNNIHFEWAFRKRPEPRFEVRLDLEKPDYEENKRILLELGKSKDELEKLLNEKINFDYQFGRKWCKLYVVNKDVDNRKQFEDWIIEITKKFYKFLKPQLDEILSKK